MRFVSLKGGYTLSRLQKRIQTWKKKVRVRVRLRIRIRVTVRVRVRAKRGFKR